MKKSLFFSLMVVFIIALSGTALAQTEKPAETAQHDAHHPDQKETAAAVETAPADLPAQLEQMAQNLMQDNVTPAQLKQMAEQMQQMAQRLKQMPGMAEGGKMKPMMDKMAGDMSGMMCGKMMEKMKAMKPKMMENSVEGMMDCNKMMAMKHKMMQDKSMMEMNPMMPMMSMMPMMRTKQDPKSMSQMMQMHGEMMKAMGDIMLKYGKLMAEEATPVASIEQSAKTATYEVALEIGPLETMLTPEEAKTAKEGEVMTSGEMTMSMPDMPLTHHLEVSVKDLKSGAAVTNQAVTIAVTNDTTQTVANVPVATMHGLDEGVADTHFGNNVALPAGDYTIVVTVGKETATFHMTIPAS